VDLSLASETAVDSSDFMFVCR